MVIRFPCSLRKVGESHSKRRVLRNYAAESNAALTVCQWKYVASANTGARHAVPLSYRQFHRESTTFSRLAFDRDSSTMRVDDPLHDR